MPADAMTEQELLDAIIELAQLLKLKVHHCRPARTSTGWCTPIQGTPGFPDLVIAGALGCLFREVKSATGRCTTEQSVWLALLPDGEVWTPKEWRSGLIERELRQISARNR
jgi:hypothetical protein